ncbi:hypothetical protein BH10PSE12_BH10PSE12_29060 [soil metagenome]
MNHDNDARRSFGAHLDMAMTLLFGLMRFSPQEAMLLRAGAQQMRLAVIATVGRAARR